MSYNDDPSNSAIDRVRLKVGDTDPDEVGLSDEVYQFLLTKNDNDENLTAVEALEFLVAKYAAYVTEKAGGLFVKESEKYQQYRDLLDLFTRDPRTSLNGGGKAFAGGISNSDIAARGSNPDRRGSPFTENYLDSGKYNHTGRRL